MEIVVKDLAVDEVVDTIRSAVATGEVGDGKIFIVPIVMSFVFVLANGAETLFNVILN